MKSILKKSNTKRNNKNSVSFQEDNNTIESTLSRADLKEEEKKNYWSSRDELSDKKQKREVILKSGPTLFSLPRTDENQLNQEDYMDTYEKLQIRKRFKKVLYKDGYNKQYYGGYLQRNHQSDGTISRQERFLNQSLLHLNKRSERGALSRANRDQDQVVEWNR